MYLRILKSFAIKYFNMNFGSGMDSHVSEDGPTTVLTDLVSGEFF